MVKDEILLRRASERNRGLGCELDPSDPLGQKRMGVIMILGRFIV